MWATVSALLCLVVRFYCYFIHVHFLLVLWTNKRIRMYLRETYAGPLRRTSRQVYFSPVQRTCMRRRTSAVFGTTDDKTCKLNPDDCKCGCAVAMRPFAKFLRTHFTSWGLRSFVLNFHSVQSGPPISDPAFSDADSWSAFSGSAYSVHPWGRIIPPHTSVIDSRWPNPMNCVTIPPDYITSDTASKRSYRHAGNFLAIRVAISLASNGKLQRTTYVWH